MNRAAFTPLLALALALAASACAPSAPPRWAEGGTRLVIAASRWERPGEDAIELQPNGRVLEGGKLRFVIDRVGRVTDDDYDAFAVLQPDGQAVGTDDRSLGYVGVNNSSPPLAEQAWLSISPDGAVVFFRPDGERVALGKWSGCAGASRRTCTLVTQMFLMRNYQASPSGPRFGVGIGIGMGF